MKTAIVRAKVDPELKKSAEQILGTIGLSTSRAITLLLHQIVLMEGLPFDLYIPSKRVEKNIRASREGRSKASYSSSDDVLAALKGDRCTQESKSTKNSVRSMPKGKKLATV